MWFSAFTRRNFLSHSAAVAFASLVPNISMAKNPTEQKLHGLSAFGDLKYPSNYTQFDDAVIDAPKGGTLAFSPSSWAFNQNVQTFDTLNSFVQRGIAPPRMELCYDTLMVGSPDEPDSLYCALSSSVEISDDRNTYRFIIRPEARFHDGSKVTAEDVSFSYMILKEEGHASLVQTLRDLDAAAVVADDIVELRFNGKHSTFEVPLSSGGWRISRLDGGKFVEYERVKDYWAKDMPFAVGFGHFDKLRIDFFRDRIAPFEAFKKGEITWREEFTSKVWATEYNFPAVEDGRVKQAEFPSELTPSMQGWALNSRKSKFKDQRTREAIGLCFDFEWANKNLFYGAYQRSSSIFEKSEFKALGKPSPEEMKLLEPYKDELPEMVFGEALEPNETNGSGNDRKALRKALSLLKDAGWTRADGGLVNGEGEVLEVEFLIRSPVFERILGNYRENLEKVGIKTSIRLVDSAQFQSRLNSFDFDIVGVASSFSASPTAESLRFFLHSDSASQNGSRNYPGIESPVIDALIERMNSVSTREELAIILSSIDRVLRSMHLWIPNWYAANHRVAHWDMFGWKDPKPDYSFAPEALWWFDEEKAKAIGKA